MRVILLKDVPALGPAGTIKDVKEGYARNYLIPRGLAAEATAGNVRALERQRQASAQRAARERGEIEATAAALAQAVVEIRARGGEGGRLFGSVTAQDIAEALARRGVAVSKRQIELAEPLKSAGFYTVPVRLGGGVVVQVEVNVVATD